MSYDLRIRNIYNHVWTGKVHTLNNTWVRNVTMDEALKIVEKNEEELAEGDDYYYDLYYSQTGEHAFAYMADFAPDAPIWMSTADYVSVDDEFACYV